MVLSQYLLGPYDNYLHLPDSKPSKGDLVCILKLHDLDFGGTIQLPGHSGKTKSYGS